MAKLKKPKINKGEFAKRLGISPTLFAHHQKNPLAPKELDLEQWGEFLLEVRRDVGLPAAVRKKIADARLKNLLLDAERKQTQNRNERHELIDFAIAARTLRDFASVVTFATLDRLKREFAVTLVGRTSLEIDALMEEQIERARKLAHDALDSFEKLGPASLPGSKVPASPSEEYSRQEASHE